MISIFSILFIAVGLSMDSFAVSVSNGLSIRNLAINKKLSIAFSLAFFQALFPFLGWLSGIGVEAYIKEIGYWIAFVLLSFIGSKMIYESRFSEKTLNRKDELKWSTLLLQSIATSIDAFAVGISFAFLEINIYYSVLIIGLVTFLFSIIGLYLGQQVGAKIGAKAELFGGALLIAIGLKILIEHLVLT